MVWIRLILVSLLWTGVVMPSRGAEIAPPNPVPRDTLIEVTLDDGSNPVIVTAVRNDAQGQIELTKMKVGQVGGKAFFTGPPGSYMVSGVDSNVFFQEVVRIVAGGPDPVPPGPGPGPGPGPNPPTPPPDNVVPFPSDGLAVMIIHEASEVGLLPQEQRSIFTSSRVLNYLRGKCHTLDDGKPAARIFDDDYPDSLMARTPKVIQDAYKAAKSTSDGERPWIVISTGTDGFVGPLPATIEETMTLLTKYGG